MGKSDQIYPGERLKGFFRNIFAGEPSVAPDVRERIVDALAQRINLMRVWDYPDPPDQTAASPVTTAEPLPAPLETSEYTPWPEFDQATCDALAAAGAEVEPDTFDPYAFNAMVVFRREGPAALFARLDAIASTEHLRLLAEAQHLAVPSGLDQAADLRRAIVEGTEQRLADRQAAGS